LGRGGWGGKGQNDMGKQNENGGGGEKI